MISSEPFFPMMIESKRIEILRLAVMEQEALNLKIQGKLSRIERMHPEVMGHCPNCGESYPCSTIRIIKDK